MNSKAKNNDIGEEKLEDILRSIRGVIDNHGHSTVAIDKDEYVNLDESILELTTEFKEDNQSESSFLSKDTADKFGAAIEDFTNKLDNTSLNKQQENKVDMTIANLITPMLKEWLDNNLPRIVEKIVAEELKKLIPKK